MFKTAHNIVGALYTWGPDEKRKRCGHDDIHLSASSLDLSVQDEDVISQAKDDDDRDDSFDGSTKESIDEDSSFKNASEAGISKQRSRAKSIDEDTED